jgi:hypothetical protein
VIQKAVGTMIALNFSYCSNTTQHPHLIPSIPIGFSRAFYILAGENTDDTIDQAKVHTFFDFTPNYDCSMPHSVIGLKIEPAA